jgi:hypothetical protein
MLVGCFVVAGFTAGFAVHQAVCANADVDDCLAQTTKLFAFAGGLGLFALHAAVLGGAGSGIHEARLASSPCIGNVTEVMDGWLVVSDQWSVVSPRFGNMAFSSKEHTRGADFPRDYSYFWPLTTSH